MRRPVQPKTPDAGHICRGGSAMTAGVFPRASGTEPGARSIDYFARHPGHGAGTCSQGAPFEEMRRVANVPSRLPKKRRLGAARLFDFAGWWLSVGTAAGAAWGCPGTPFFEVENQSCNASTLSSAPIRDGRWSATIWRQTLAKPVSVPVAPTKKRWMSCERYTECRDSVTPPPGIRHMRAGAVDIAGALKVIVHCHQSMRGTSEGDNRSARQARCRGCAVCGRGPHVLKWHSEHATTPQGTVPKGNGPTEHKRCSEPVRGRRSKTPNARSKAGVGGSSRPAKSPRVPMGLVGRVDVQPARPKFVPGVRSQMRLRAGTGGVDDLSGGRARQPELLRYSAVLAPPVVENTECVKWFKRASSMGDVTMHRGAKTPPPAGSVSRHLLPAAWRDDTHGASVRSTLGGVLRVGLACRFGLATEVWINAEEATDARRRSGRSSQGRTGRGALQTVRGCRLIDGTGNESHPESGSTAMGDSPERRAPITSYGVNRQSPLTRKPARRTSSVAVIFARCPACGGSADWGEYKRISE